MHTEHLSGIPINTNFSRMETNLDAGECMEYSKDMMHLVYCINKRSLELLNGFIDFKESILNKMESCKLFSFYYPLLVQHILMMPHIFPVFLHTNVRTLKKG